MKESKLKNFTYWLLGYPKCKKGGRCNSDNEIQYSLGSKRFFEYSNRWRCSKCFNETTKYTEI